MDLDNSPEVELVLNIAEEKANELMSDVVGTEHILMAIMLLGKGEAFQILTSWGADRDSIIERAAKDSPSSGARSPDGPLPQSSQRLQEALQELPSIAADFNSSTVNTEHLLLAILHDKTSVASGILQGFGIEYGRVHEELATRRLSVRDQSPTEGPIVEGGFSEAFGEGFRGPPQQSREGGGEETSSTTQPERIPIRSYVVEEGLVIGKGFESVFSTAAYAAAYRFSASTAVTEAFAVDTCSLLFACWIEDSIVRDTLSGAGFDLQTYQARKNLDGFEGGKSAIALDNVLMERDVAQCLARYKGDFRYRKIVDAPAIAYGILRGSEDSFSSEFPEVGSGLGEALGLLTAMLRQPPKVVLHGDRWTLHDLLGYDLYARAIVEYILHKDTEPPLVIGVQAPWGQGKTSLMRMTQKRLDPEHPDLPRESPERQGTTEPRDTQRQHPAAFGSGSAPSPSEKSEKREGSPMRWIWHHLYPKDRRCRPLDEGSGEDETSLPVLTFAELKRYLERRTVAILPEKARRRTVWFNAWKYQNSEEIWAGLAHCILSQLTSRLETRARELFWLKLQLRRVDAAAVRRDIHRAAVEKFLPVLTGKLMLVLGVLFLCGIVVVAGSSWIGGATCLDTDEVKALGVLASLIPVFGGLVRSWLGWAKATKQVLAKPLQGAYTRYVQQPDYAGRLGFLHLVQEDMRRALELLVDPAEPIVVFIDDLDRCSPRNIAQVIEAVNLFLAGDYPGCVFVLGIDAQVVAASLEVVHRRVVGMLSERQGELGWCFMDKFIQLPFVIPRLAPQDRGEFLSRLSMSRTEQDLPLELRDRYEQASEAVKSKTTAGEEASKKLAAVAPELRKREPRLASELAEKLVEKRAKEFTDQDPEMQFQLGKYLDYLSENPRTIKRAVNLYRFQQLVAWARESSGLALQSASPEQIARWSVVLVRWPQFVRWIQMQAEQGAGEDRGTQVTQHDRVLEGVIQMAREAHTVGEWSKKLKGGGISHIGWGTDRDLWQFLHESVVPDLELFEASSRGFW